MNRNRSLDQQISMLLNFKMFKDIGNAVGAPFQAFRLKKYCNFTKKIIIQKKLESYQGTLVFPQHSITVLICKARSALDDPYQQAHRLLTGSSFFIFLSWRRSLV